MAAGPGVSAAVSGATAPAPAAPRAEPTDEASRGRLTPPGGWRPILLVALTGLVALRLATAAGVVGKAAIPDLARGVGASVVLFGVMGLGATRLLLPPGLRRHEALWVMPVGACVAGLVMTVLGFLAVPFLPNLILTLLLGVGLAVYALRERPPSGRAAALRAAGRASWPFWIAALAVAVALIPLFRAGFATVEGQGQDAHLAVGSAGFLQDHYPSSVHPEEPVDRMPIVWRSKYAIYYGLAAASKLSGLDPYQTISAMAAVLLGLATLGIFVFAREVLSAPRWAGVTAMGLVALDRMVLHTVMHPYFNQTWGFMAMPFAFVLCWWAVKERTRGGLALLAIFFLTLAFAYPLALPIPLVPIGFVLWPHRKRVKELKRYWKGPKTLIWLVPALAILSQPLLGVWEKVSVANTIVFDLSRPLTSWGGDLTAWFPEPWFFGIQGWGAFLLVLPVLVYAIHLALRDQEPALRKALWGVMAFTVLFTLYFRVRPVGYYFHFKLLAYVAPFALAIAVAGLAKLKRPRWGYAAATLLVLFGIGAANQELGGTFDQLPKPVLQLREIDAALPPGQSVRLDVDPQEQNWTAFWLSGQPLCSQKPLLDTSYPHVEVSRKADYILTHKDAPVPADATGAPVKTIDAYALYRQKPDVPGPMNCSQTMVQTILITSR